MIDTFTCPNCKHTFKMDALLSAQVQQALQVEIAQERARFDAEITKQRQENQQTLQQLHEQKQTLVRQEAQFKAQMEQVLQKERDQMQAQIQQEQARLQAQNAAQLQIQREKIEKTLQAKLEAEYELKFKEQEMQKERLEKAIQEANRKAQPSISQQLQGEAQELAIETYLRDKFPLDHIQEIKKGQRGADCLQRVRNNRGQDCGMICYESKRAKDFKEEWVETLTQNKREAGAHLGVLVSAHLPSTMERMGLYKGVYVCTFQEFKGLCGILREMIINLAWAQQSQENKGSKMGDLYDYLIGSEFAKEVENAIAIFSAMRASIHEEKQAAKSYMAKLEKQWAKREKQIEGLQFIVARTRGSIEGIAGNAIVPIKALELGLDGDD
ncbi:DUF2130 domain-containing protein [Helicobacter vulpis]|uniref:DUF2130 domain-containing protein n=1 Tax=Helicobacter vulpis TaxID=2316076 RepID=UPI000EB01936|nr:DUF2130 domain-containing protein [Helicobacter vulpis]